MEERAPMPPPLAAVKCEARSELYSWTSFTELTNKPRTVAGTAVRSLVRARPTPSGLEHGHEIPDQLDTRRIVIGFGRMDDHFADQGARSLQRLGITACGTRRAEIADLAA